jgi:hypothetical protein
MKKTTPLIVALISLTLIPLELTWTRILSAEFFYTFAFLVLSVAILGLGLGGLALRLFASLNRPQLIGLYLCLTAILAVLGPMLVFAIAPDFSSLFSSWLTLGKLGLTVLTLMSAYFFGGLALALIFKENHAAMPQLYMADLLGAGFGVLAAILAMNTFGTLPASVLVALPVLVAAMIVGRGVGKIAPFVLAVLVIVLAPSSDRWLELQRSERAPVIFTHWDAMSKIKVYDYGPDSRGINIDNVANTPVYRFDGNWADVHPDSVEWPIDVSHLIRQFDSCVFLSLGSGGGSDVFQALVEGATEIHAVEVNGYINHMMLVADTTGYLRPQPQPDSTELNDSTAVTAEIPPLMSVAEFSGFIFRDPRVKVATEDARAYVRRFENKFDVIYSLSSNSWAALASGSFALAENYLFTTEAFVDYWHALSDSGFMMMEHQVYAPRLVTEVIDALQRVGVASPLDHFAVYNLPQMRRTMLLLSKRPLSDSLRSFAFGELTPERFGQIHLIYPPANDSVANHLIARIIEQGWQRVADSATIDISPVTDNRPFVAQMGLWRNFTSEKRAKVSPYAEFSGFPMSSAILLMVLAVTVVIAMPLNLIPFFRRGPRLRAAPWLYFLCIGMAFMAVEIVLIQQFSLLIGPSLYSVATILLTLLVASGLGSRLAKSFGDRTVFSWIALWLVLDAVFFGLLTAWAGGLTQSVRIVIAALLVVPVGFFMGMPFPKAALRVGPLIDWGFAVNGAASVLGSVLVLFVSFTWGFSIALLLAAVVYLIAFMLLNREQAWLVEMEIDC